MVLLLGWGVQFTSVRRCEDSYWFTVALLHLVDDVAMILPTPTF